MEEGNVQGLEGRDTESLQLTLRQGVKERKKTGLLTILASATLSFFHAPCNLAEGPTLRNLGPLNEGGLGLLSSNIGIAQRQPGNAYLVRILRVCIIGLAHSVCQTNQESLGC